MSLNMIRCVLLTALAATLTASSSLGQGFPHRLEARSVPQFGTIRHTGTDERSVDFNQNVKPVIQQLAASLLASGVEFGDRHQYRLDQDKIFTTSRTPYPVRVYFISEGAGHWNSIGLSLNLAGSATSGDLRLIFPNASMPVSGVDFRTQNFGTRTANAPLLPGDFVDVGVLQAGVQLDFFIIADGARGGLKWVFTNHDALNPDKTQHVISYAIPNSPYVLIGFEDLWMGGDKDYEDVLIVVDLGRENVDNLIDASGLPH
jgi:hypothetical protein